MEKIDMKALDDAQWDPKVVVGHVALVISKINEIVDRINEHYAPLRLTARQLEAQELLKTIEEEIQKKLDRRNYEC